MTNEELDALVKRLRNSNFHLALKNEAAAAIQQLRSERDAMERLYEALFNENNGLAIQREELRQQLAECERERDSLRLSLISGKASWKDENNELRRQLATVTAERDGLRLAYVSSKASLGAPPAPTFNAKEKR